MRVGAAERTPEVEERYRTPAFEPIPRSRLKGVERFSVPLGERINTNELWKTLASGFGRNVPRHFVTWVSRRRWRIYDLENMATLQPKRGVIMVSNHRSFFDMYVAAASLFVHADFAGRLYFPVRSKFFYDNPFGALVNFSMSGYAMWPPMFRDDRKADLNPIGIKQMAYALGQRGAVLGIHPEGTRQKGDDPYVLGAARPGVGRLVEQCHPDTMILPYFILGLSNDFTRELRMRLGREPGPDIRMHWGAPLRCGDVLERASDAQDIADSLLEIVHELGQQDRAVVAKAGAQ